MPKKQCTRCKNWKACRKLTAKTHDWCYSLFYLEGFSLNADQSICLCNRCWFYLCNEKTRTGVQSENENTNDSNAMDTSVHEDQDQDQDQLTIENILFSGSSHKKCVVCRDEVNTTMITMPKPARLDLLVLKRMYAPHGVRCCRKHLWNNRLLPDVKINMDNRQTPMAKLEPTVLLNLFNDLLGLLQEASTAPRLDFMDPSMSNEDYLTWTGWTKEQFEHMFMLILSHIRSSSNREARNALAMFWIKLKTNLSFRQIGSLFNISGDYENRQKLKLFVMNGFVNRQKGNNYLDLLLTPK
ncbi:unnamed protein product [Rotaria socialis]